MRSLALFAAASGLAFVAACTKDDTKWIYDPGPHWPDRAVFPGIGNGLVATSNAYDDSISLVDAQTLTTVGKISIGLNAIELEGPHHIVASPDRQFLYVGLSEVVPNSGSGPHGNHGTGSVPGYVLKIRASDMRRIGQVRVDRSPGDLVLSPDGSKLYVSHFDVKRIEEVFAAGGTPDEMRSGIAVIDTATMVRDQLVMVCPAEHGITLSPDGSRLYVSCFGNDSLAVVDVSQPGLPHTIHPVGPAPGALPGTLAYGPYATTLGTDAKTLWLSCWESGDIRAFNTSSGQMELARTIVTGGYPMFGAIWEDRMFFARQSGDPGLPDDRLLMVNSNGTGALIEIPLPQSDCINAHAAIASPFEAWKVMVVCEGNHVQPGTVVKVDMTTGTIENKATVGIFPDAAAFVLPPVAVQ